MVAKVPKKSRSIVWPLKQGYHCSMTQRRRQPPPSAAANQVAASRARRIDGSPVGLMSSAEFRQAVQDPPERLILHGKRHSDMLVRLLTERGWGNPERLEAVKRWVDKHGASVTAPPEGFGGGYRGPYSYGNRQARAPMLTLSKDKSPLSVAMGMGDPQLVGAMVKGAWAADLHGQAFLLALSHENTDVLNMLWALDPPLHRTPIGLQYALWSDVWFDRLYDKGMVLTEPTTFSAIEYWTGTKQTKLDRFGLLSHLARVKRADEGGKDPSRRKVRGQAPAVRVDWTPVCQWAARHDLDVAIQWVRQQKADPVAFMVERHTHGQGPTLLLRMMDMMDNSRMRQLVNDPRGLSAWIGQGHDWAATMDRSFDVGVTVGVWRQALDGARKKQGRSGSVLDELVAHLDRAELTNAVSTSDTTPVAPRRRM